MQRDWVTIHDPRMQIDFVGTVGVKPWGNRSSGFDFVAASTHTWKSKNEIEVRALGSVSAFEVSFVLFDLWGQVLERVKATEVLDLPAGTSTKLRWSWNDAALQADGAFHADASNVFQASIAYVSRVRLATGETLSADGDLVNEQIAKISVIDGQSAGGTPP